MIEAFASEDVRAAEAPLLAAERGHAGGLMDRAATALALHVRRLLRERRGRVAGATVVGLVGAGNNGGDALHALALLARHGVAVRAVAATDRLHDGGLAAFRRAGGRLLALEDTWLGEAVAEAFAADVVLDGLLGIGARGALRGPAGRLVETLAALLADAGPAPAGRPVVVAVDVPSGVGVDDGAVPGPVLPADVTVTFGAPKPALLLPPAAALAGEVRAVDLGLALDADGAAVRRLGAADVAATWPVPAPDGHKYTRGVVGVVAGTPTYPGAAVLVVAGALAAGTGMVRYLGRDAVRDAVVAAHPEAVAGTGRVQSWVVGPGLADDDGQARRAAEALARAAEEDLPAVVGAGALALLPERLPAAVVLTPHAGELATLLTARGEQVDRAGIEAEPLRWARRAHELTGATVLLKGAVTLVVGPAGVLSQADAPPWLATAGAGDVLAGVTGAVLAGVRAARPDGRLEPAVVARAVAAAVAVHGRAATAANPGGPVTASAVAAAVPGVVAGLLAPVDEVGA